MKGEKGRHDLPERTKNFALQVIKLCQLLNDKPGVGWTISRQLLRSGTSIGANIAEGAGAQSEADFLTKYSIALKEAHETLFGEQGYICPVFCVKNWTNIFALSSF